MAITLFASGTQSATVGTEHFVSSPNESGVFTFHVRMNNMVSGDALELRVYQMTLTGGSAEESFCSPLYQDAQVQDYARSIPVDNNLTDTNAVRFSIKQVAGTSRNFDWKVLKHA